MGLNMGFSYTHTPHHFVLELGAKGAPHLLDLLDVNVIIVWHVGLVGLNALVVLK